jgi:serine-type D-Ala-D-Ala carboxypeptidase/endopeptidase
MKKQFVVLAAAGLSALATPVFAVTDDGLRAVLERRFRGDRTGACVAAAVIEGDTTATAYVCADPKSSRPYDRLTAFEIGSVSKTMTAALLAQLIDRGEVALDDAIAKLLPRGTETPSFNGREITLGDIVTHTSGWPSIPPQWHLPDLDNPYARLTEQDLLGALAGAKLTRAPGSQWEYSNFAMMVLSFALAKRSGKDFETLLQEQLFAPLGMDGAYIARCPPHVRLAQGHLSNTRPASPWDFPVDMAGVGGVRATLPDMVRYLEGQLGMRETAITPAMALTQQQVADVGGHRMGMNWIISSTPNSPRLLAHDGATGGYSSSVAFDVAAKRGVVLLSDTALISVGGFGTLAAHLLDPAVPIGPPRVAAHADPKLIDGLVGRYRLQNGLGMDLRRKGSALAIQADGQPEFEMGYDSAGDFYPLEFDALLRPVRKADGTYAFTWFQLGGALEAKRIDPAAPAANRWVPTEAQLKEYEGNYPLAPAFALRILSVGDRLFVQGTNQSPLEVAPVDKDVFVADSVGAEVTFERDTDAKVTALTLRQRGQVLRGERH